ncbi:MAG: hypothetical protein DDT41_00537 [candidate division WS2 bacterium]|nr:hypothetical protein [Candidatus Psychracetigena formicireducens]
MNKLKGLYVVNEKGRKTAVIVPIREYEYLLQDLHDLMVVAERRDEPVVNFEELKEKLRKDGLL